MLDWFKNNIIAVFGRKDKDCNNKISTRQKVVVKLVLAVIILMGFTLSILVQEKTNANNLKKKPEKTALYKIELPDSSLDKERRWREHYEKIISSQNKAMQNVGKRLKLMEDSRSKIVSEASSALNNDLAETKIKLEMAQAELSSAALELRRVSQEEHDRIESKSTHIESSLNVQAFEQGVEFDRPKSAENYIPEGTFFTGNLLGGIVVSTALNNPDEHNTPIIMMLKKRGNLHPLNKIDISKCKIMGSAKGDLSSERVIVRLEKMICEKNGFYQTSNIAGEIEGPDGLNGIKGTVIYTATKHIKNAAIGGLISGLSGASKGKEGMSLSSGGLMSTQKKGMSQMLGQGAMQGVSNAGDKVAEHYLKMADAMSPVLTVPSGVRINAKIIKGFFVGELSTHRKIKKSKK